MTTRKAIPTLAFAGILAFSTAVCDDEPSGPLTTTLRGPEVAVAQGFARTELVLDRDDQPQSLAVVFTEAALTGLPATTPQGGSEFVLPLPAGAALVFDHATLNWNPGGHPPPGIYDRPHFDAHFYMISIAERNTMTPADPQFAAKSTAQPGAQFIPGDYAGDPFGIPRMGTHWVSRTAPEHHGAQFTKALVYGFYDAKMVFIEPMVTKAMLDARTAVDEQLAVPASYPRPGRYPTRYSIKYDATAREYRIELSGFVARS